MRQPLRAAATTGPGTPPETSNSLGVRQSGLTGDASASSRRTSATRSATPIPAKLDATMSSPGARTRRAHDLDGLLSALQGHGPEEPDDAQEMIGVKMGDEDGLDPETRPVPHHLPLGALAAVEEHQIAFSLHGDAAHIPAHSGPGSGGAEEGDSNHGATGLIRIDVGSGKNRPSPGR